MPSPPVSAAFARINEQIAALGARAPTSVQSGHVSLEEAIWLSCDPQGQARMSCAPQDDGFHLNWTAADTGRWACLGLSLHRDVVATGRYLGLLIEAEAETPVSFMPCLRYNFQDGGIQDVGPPDPVLLPTGRRRHLIHVPIDAALMERSQASEVNLFVHTDAGGLSVKHFEILLMT